LELTGTVDKRHMHAQYLDQLELERERGITIKMAPVRMHWRPSRRLTQMGTQINADNEETAQKPELLYEEITYKIRGAAFKIYNSLGPGHKENIYQNSFALELAKSNLSFEREKKIEVTYDGEEVGIYQPDFVVEEKVVIELKALPFLGNPPKKQTRYYLKGSDYKLALLINFGAEKLEIERIIYDSIRENRLENPHVSADSEYILNLIDTPGHSDFGYEVSRALAAVEGGILLVDATQGIQAQTLANFRSAKNAGLAVIGAVNKIDLFKKPGDEEKLSHLKKEVAELIGAESKDILLVSGKTGEGVEKLLEAVIEKVPPPRISDYQLSNQRQSAMPARALIFDSFYDNHKGVIASVRVFDGEIDASQNVFLVASDTTSKIKEVGFFKPQVQAAPRLKAGEIGYIATGIKDTSLIKIGDTAIVAGRHPDKIKSFILPGYREPKPVVFVSFYPEENDDYELLKKSLEKLKLNDSALTIEPDQNEVLGRGYKVGFLGRLHFEITAERLKREYKVGTVSTFPSVIYKIKTRKEWQTIVKPEELPEEYEEIWEPMTDITILVPPEYLNNVYPLQARFRFTNITTHTFQDQTEIKAGMPLAELVSDFDDQLKSATAGFASFSYELADYAKADIEKVDILVAGDVVPGLSRFFPKSTMEKESRKMVEKLKETLPRQQFAQPIQARAENKFIAREDIPAMRKDVTGYLYGGDRSRKMKLWSKQKKGKKKLQSRAQVRISPSVFKELIKK
jgi:GTP-binding protein LepA